MTDKPFPACCPVCDNAIQDYEPVGVYYAHEMKCLAHECCLEEIESEVFDEDEDEEDV